MKSKRKFRGFVVDRLGTIKTKKTRFYKSYYEAHKQAERLCQRTIKDRGEISVEEY